MELQRLIEISRQTRAAAQAARIQAQAQVAAARAARQAAAEQWTRALCGGRRRKRRVVVYLPEAARLDHVCRHFLGLDCDVFATTEYARAAAEIASDRAIDLLVTEETLSQLGRPALLH